MGRNNSTIPKPQQFNRLSLRMDLWISSMPLTRMSLLIHARDKVIDVSKMSSRTLASTLYVARCLCVFFNVDWWQWPLLFCDRLPWNIITYSIFQCATPSPGTYFSNRHYSLHNVELMAWISNYLNCLMRAPIDVLTSTAIYLKLPCSQRMVY